MRGAATDAINCLEGNILPDGWTVGKRLEQGPESSGGNFSVSYVVESKDGKPGFMKVLDFRRALRSADVIGAIQQLTTMYVFERDLLDYCKDRRISNVVTSITHGQFIASEDLVDRLFYIIFELADGDARTQISALNHRDYVWCYRALHHMAVALQSLHRNDVYHQDVKPSNLLVFDNGSQNKLGDLGRSHTTAIASPIAKLTVPGDPRYAPIEQLYGFVIADDRAWRVTGDLYALGSMLFFMFTGNMLTPALTEKLAPEHKPYNKSSGTGWSGLGSDMLPYLETAFTTVLLELEGALRSEIPVSLQPKFVPETVALFRMLAEPDPNNRGFRAARMPLHVSKYALERFVSAFGRLATAAEILGSKNG